MEEVGNAEVGLVSRSEYHDPVVARLLITTVCMPDAVPGGRGRGEVIGVR